MNTYHVINITSAHSFGIYAATTADSAIEACCRDAGYESKEAAEEAMEHGAELVATLEVADETAHLLSGANGRRLLSTIAAA